PRGATAEPRRPPSASARSSASAAARRMHRGVRRCIAAVLGLFALLASCGRAAPRQYEVVAEWPHDTRAYTQGLVFHDGVLYESTGRYGESELRRVEPETGRVLHRVPLPADRFGEGIAIVGDRLYQL